jgi:hypothetical protein
MRRAVGRGRLLETAISLTDITGWAVSKHRMTSSPRAITSMKSPLAVERMSLAFRRSLCVSELGGALLRRRAGASRCQDMSRFGSNKTRTFVRYSGILTAAEGEIKPYEAIDAPPRQRKNAT